MGSREDDAYWENKYGCNDSDCPCQEEDDTAEQCTCDYLKSQYDPGYRQCQFCQDLEADVASQVQREDTGHAS